MLLVSLLFLASNPAFASAPVAPQEDITYAEVGAEGAKLHAFYDKKSAVVLELEAGMPLQVVAQLTPWSKVRVPGGLDVWVHQDYVAWEGGRGSITARRVRIRPMPSTEASSTPLGHFQKGDEVLLLGQEGEWFQVRAPETVSAWILTEALSTPERSAKAWQDKWVGFAETRRIEVPDEVVETVEDPMEGLEAPFPFPGGAESEGKVIEAATKDVGATDAEEAAAGTDTWTLFRSVDVAKDPEQQRKAAFAKLEVLGTAVTRDNAAWNRRRLDNLEMVFGNVIWHASDLRSIEAARTSLTRIDGLRRFYFSNLAADIRRAMAAGERQQAALLEERLAAEKKPMVYAGEGTSVEVGWVEYHPNVNANMPYRLVRGGRSLPMHSFDGHQDLKEFVNREIVVRGVWRDESKLQAGRVLAITELRVLPTRGE
ncbi:MAG: SH3 domain-containing protein [Planctomycetota bacterium]|jgi:SH3-like domain-containing protein